MDVTASKRFMACVAGVKALASPCPDGSWDDYHVHVSSYNTFPTAAGLASSAAGYAALVSALAEVYKAKETYKGELSTVARQGSGSACRSVYGGFVAWREGVKEDGSDSLAEQVCGEEHWPEVRRREGRFVVRDALLSAPSKT